MKDGARSICAARIGPMSKRTILTPRRRNDQLRHERNEHHPTLAQVEPSTVEMR
jgi:hypothetical protein